MTAMCAVILAGDRGPDDPLVQASAAPCKAMVPVGGRPMVLRVIEAVRAAEAVGDVVICGPAESLVRSLPELAELIDGSAVRWLAPRATPSRSLEAAFESVDVGTPVLLTTADHALLTPEIIDGFCSQARAGGGDVAVAAASSDAVTAAFPEVRRTAFRLRDGAWCGCNLFAFLTPASRRAATFWRRVEAERKHPLRLARMLGWRVLLRFVTRRLTLAAAVDEIGRLMGLTARAVVQTDPRAAVDVDSVGDWEAVNRIAAG